MPENTMTEDEPAVQANGVSDGTPPKMEGPITSPYKHGVEVTTAPVENDSIQLVRSSNLTSWLLFNIGVPIALLAGAGGLVAALGSIQPSTRPPADQSREGRLQALPAVEVVPIQSLADSGERLHLNSDGTVVPFREVILATEVAGRIIEKSDQCEAGQYVTAGTVLMRIDPTDYELAVQRLEQSQQSEYEQIREVDQELINSKRLLEIADADIELQSREVKRLEKLPEDFAARKELDTARRAVLQAEQQKVTYQNQIDLLRTRRSRLELAEQLAATQLKQATIDLQRTEIRAPIDGVVVSEQAELNTFVARGNAVVTMEDTSKVEVATSLRMDQLYWVLNQKKTESPIDDLNAPANGAHRGYKLPPTSVEVHYQLSGRDDVSYVWDGQLLGYDGIGMDEQTRTVPVRVVVDQPQVFEVRRNDVADAAADPAVQNMVAAGPTALVRGMFVRLRLELDPAVPLVILPAEALKPGNRVWEFIPDEAVLDEVAAKDSAETDEADAAKPEAEPDAESIAKDGDKSSESELVFDANAWSAGRLVIRQDVRPIDLLSTFGGTSDHWICEVPDQSIHGDSFVVVSPLGSIESDSFPVRAPAKSLSPESESAEEAAAAESKLTKR